MKLEIKNLNFKYEGNNILKNISFKIESGENVVLVGSNGSGKSTLLKNLLGLKKIKEGSVFYGGKDITKDKNYLKNIGFVFQNPEDQFVYSVVKEELVFRMQNLGFDRKKISKKINEVLSQLNISELIYKNLSELSGGEMQKIALASQLALDSKILVLDEPTSMLDIKSSSDFNDSLKFFKGITILRVTHNSADIVSADRVLVLHEGVIISNCKPTDFFNNEFLLKVCRINKPINLIIKEGK